MRSGSQNPAAAGASPGGRPSRLASRGRRKEEEHESVGARDGREGGRLRVLSGESPPGGCSPGTAGG